MYKSGSYDLEYGRWFEPTPSDNTNNPHQDIMKDYYPKRSRRPGPRCSDQPPSQRIIEKCCLEIGLINQSIKARRGAIKITW